MNVTRLFNSFQPERYDVHIQIHEEKMTFRGTVIVSGKKVGRPSKRLTLHQKDITIHSATITHKDKKGHVAKEVARINNHKKYDEVRLHTHETLYPGHYSLELTFSGKITRNMNGIYPCYYEENGEKKQIIATQFESHHAREVFPCIDEPEAKAVFGLTLDTRQTTVIANTPVVSQENNDDVLTTRFEDTPVMSTYLLAFVVGDMSFREAKTARGVAVRAFSTPDNIALTDFALDTAVKCIEFYEDFFGIDYPLEKCDLIALPDFASGAMENWGCITFREQCMLVDHENTTIPTKQYVAMVVAHELAHMWFGNLVTMRWWTDLWLNEGFATWVEYLATDALFPEWNMWTQFVVDEQQQSMKLDSLENTHPIEVAVHHPDEIRTIFDAISYSKGASVIHQLHAYVGADTFKKGLGLYLKRHAYKNTNTEDLWQALSEASGKDIKQFMHGWTSQPGFPILEVSKKPTGDLELRQKRFYLARPEGTLHEHAWHIPLLNSRLGETAVMATKSMALVEGTEEPLLLNARRSGFYRVSYEESLLTQLTELIEDKKLDQLDRMGLLADLFEASKSGDMSTVSTLRFLEHYKNEDSVIVWSVISSIIGGIRLVLGSEELRSAIKPFIIALAEPEYKRLGWHKKDSDSYFDQLLRPSILGMLASADYEEIVTKCHDLFAKITEVDDVSPELRTNASATQVKRSFDIDPDVRGVVFGTVARHGTMKTFQKLRKLYNETTLSEEKLTLAAAITDFSDEACIDASLKMIRSEDVRLQDVGYWIAYSFLNHHARSKAWEWLKENWSWLEQNLGSDLSFYRTPIYAARVHSSSEFAEAYQEFFARHMSPGLERSYKQGLEMLEWHAQWRKRDEKAVLAYITAQKSL